MAAGRAALGGLSWVGLGGLVRVLDKQTLLRALYCILFVCLSARNDSEFACSIFSLCTAFFGVVIFRSLQLRMTLYALSLRRSSRAPHIASARKSPRQDLASVNSAQVTSPGRARKTKSCDSCGLLAAVPRSSPARRRPSARSPAEARSFSSALHSLNACFSAPVQTLSLHSRRAGSVTRRHSDANVCSPPPPLRTTGPWRLCLTKYHVYILRAARHGRQRHCSSSSRSTSRRSSSGTAAAANNNSAAVQLQRGGLCEAHRI